MDTEDTVQVLNKSNNQVVVWWGTNAFFIPPNSKATLPKIAAKAASSMEAYSMLEIEDESTNAETGKGTEVTKVGNEEQPKGEVLEPWSDINWDPTTCPMEECVQYASKFNLEIPENSDSESYRTVVDEHFLSGLE